MTIAFDPQPSASQKTGIRNEYPNLREITDETMYEEKPEEQPGRLHDSDEEWIQMYLGKTMEENY